VKGLTKTLSPGCRIAAVHASGMILDKLIASKVSIDIASPLLTQRAVLAFIRSRKLKDHYEKLRIALEVRRDRIVAAFKERLGDRIQLQPPHGGLNLWIQLPETINTEELLVKGLSQNVSFLPGTACYTSHYNQQFLRLSFSAVSDHDLDEGVDRLIQLIKNEM
jgi:DNA-binding transcriptional MocR family regulator